MAYLKSYEPPFHPHPQITILICVVVLWLLAVFVRVKTGGHAGQRSLGIDVCAIYWTFVVVLWPILYVLVYLI